MTAVVVERTISMQSFRSVTTARARFPPVLLATFLILVAGLVLYSQTWAWYGDEGFHLLASQLILSGKKTYVDFLYPQTPMWAYIDAGWMKIFGDTWRSSHMLAALLTGGSIILSADFVFERIPESEWRLTAALIAAVLIGLDTVVIGFGTVGQPYGICLFLITAAFRIVVKGVNQKKPSLLLWAGLCAGGSAGSSLLSAPVLPILLGWTAWRSFGRSLTPCVWLLLGTGISFLPIAWLALLAPHQTLFNIFEYHFLHRSPNNWVALQFSVRTLINLLNSGQFMLRVVFAVIGLLFVLGHREWEEQRKSEFYLCSLLAGGLGLFLITVRITYTQYFILLTPFLSILASVGIVAVASWLRPPGRQWLVPGVLALFVGGLPFWLWQQHNRLNWPQLTEVARAVNFITPHDGLIFADEMIYFAARRIPPSGLENTDTHKLQFSPRESESLHIFSLAELYDQVAAGRFATVATCSATENWIDKSGIRKVYSERATMHDCDIFWSRRDH
jgi:hypothetical protein